MFISFITSTANDLCKGAKRQVREKQGLLRETEERKVCRIRCEWFSVSTSSFSHLRLSLSLSKRNKKNLRKTISSDDVVNALADSGFEELAAPLRQEAEAKRVAAKEAAEERKRDRAAEAAAEAEAAAVPAAN